MTFFEKIGANLAYRIYLNKRRSACLIFRVSSAVLIRGRCLFEGGGYLISYCNSYREEKEGGWCCRTGKVFSLHARTEEREDLKRELNERASRYTHFELKNITIDESKFPLLALNRIAASTVYIYVILWKYSNKHRTTAAALIRGLFVY